MIGFCCTCTEKASARSFERTAHFERSAHGSFLCRTITEDFDTALALHSGRYDSVYVNLERGCANLGDLNGEVIGHTVVTGDCHEGHQSQGTLVTGDTSHRGHQSQERVTG